MGPLVLALLAGLPWTLAVTGASLALGLPLGTLLCALRLSRVAGLRLLAAIVILTLRAVPPIVWLFAIAFGLGAAPPTLRAFGAAIVGLGLISGAHLAEIFRGALSAVPTGQWEAATVLALPIRSRLTEVIGPQMLRIALPSATHYAVALLKDSAVASTVGVTDIAFQAFDTAHRIDHGVAVFAVAGALYLALGLPIAVAGRWADLRLRAALAP